MEMSGNRFTSDYSYRKRLRASNSPVPVQNTGWEPGSSQVKSSLVLLSVDSHLHCVLGEASTLESTFVPVHVGFLSEVVCCLCSDLT